MNSPVPRPDSEVDARAAYWAARLDGSVLEANERIALDAWLAERPEHRSALSQYCQLSADLEEQLPHLVASGAVAMPPPRRPAGSRWRWATLALASAAALAVIGWQFRPQPVVENVATSVAQRQTATLADGTRVELNAHTTLRFENQPGERRARLAGGEAFFTVAPDAQRPFIVETPGGTIRVTGTIFNVRNSAPFTPFTVTVLEGSVQVRPTSGDESASSPYALAPQQQLTVDGAAVAVRTLGRSELEQTLAWRDGKIVFVDVPLEIVAARLARHHGRRIVVDPAVAQLAVGGRFGLDDWNAFSAALQAALPVRVEYDLSGAVTIGPRPGS